MTFNILDGGISGNESRIEHIIKVINDERPDFLALQEANHFDKNNNALLKRVSRETELSHYALSQGSPNKEEDPYHVASLSRYPLLHVEEFLSSSFQSAALSVTIKSPLLGELSLCNVHLHSSSEVQRIEEISQILNHQSKFPNHIILGDHNALSASDFSNGLSADHLAAGEFTNYDLTRFDLTDLLRDKGYVDSIAHLDVQNRHTHPTSGCPHPISKTPIRIDYIWGTPSLRPLMQEAAVIRTLSAKKASDHYPVTLTLGKPPGTVVLNR